MIYNSKITIFQIGMLMSTVLPVSQIYVLYNNAMSLDLRLLPPNEQHKEIIHFWKARVAKKIFDRANSHLHFFACGPKQDTYSVSLLSNAFKSETKKTTHLSYTFINVL